MSSCAGSPVFPLRHRLGGGDGLVSKSWDGTTTAGARRSLRRGCVGHSFCFVIDSISLSSIHRKRLLVAAPKTLSVPLRFSRACVCSGVSRGSCSSSPATGAGR